MITTSSGGDFKKHRTLLWSNVLQDVVGPNCVEKMCYEAQEGTKV